MDRTFVGESSFCLLMCWWGQRLPFLTIFVPYMEHTFLFYVLHQEVIANITHLYHSCVLIMSLVL